MRQELKDEDGKMGMGWGLGAGEQRLGVGGEGLRKGGSRDRGSEQN